MKYVSRVHFVLSLLGSLFWISIFWTTSAAFGKAAKSPPREQASSPKLSQSSVSSNSFDSSDVSETKNKQEKRKEDPIPIPPPTHQIPRALLKLGEGLYFSPYAFVMDKSLRTLSIWKKSNKKIEFVSAHSADLGRKPGDKHVLGDLKTPEGIYFFQEMYEGPHLDFSQYGSRAFTMDYPNFFDRLDKKTGHGIWLHSIPNSESLYRGSRGCIVVRNNVIQSISPYINIKFTPIIVQNKVRYMPQDEHQALREGVLTWLHSWKASWENKNIESYISHYENRFRSQGKNKKRWKKYKEGLNEQYNYIRVSIKNPVVYLDDGKVIIRFLQTYQSDKMSDFGEKTLYLTERKYKDLSSTPSPTTMSYGIIGETWSTLSEEAIGGKNEGSVVESRM